MTTYTYDPTSGGLIPQAQRTIEVTINGIDVNAVVGAQGPKGDTGAKGDKGDAGAAGAQGPPGSTGSRWLDEEEAIVRNGALSIGQQGQIPFGVGPHGLTGVVSFRSVGVDRYYPKHVGSASFM